MHYNLQRFLDAQDGKTFLPPIKVAYRELGNGEKRSDWIWYVFPQIAGLGESILSKKYSIVSIGEAKAYLSHPLLSLRLRNIIGTLLVFKTKSILSIMKKDIDVKKVQASLTLFDYICPSDIFNDALGVFYNGKRHEKTLKIIQNV